MNLDLYALLLQFCNSLWCFFQTLKLDSAIDQPHIIKKNGTIVQADERKKVAKKFGALKNIVFYVGVD